MGILFKSNTFWLNCFAFHPRPTPDDSPRNLLARGVCAGNRTQAVKRRRVLPGKKDVLLRHPVPDRFHIACSIRHADLEVAVAAVAGELVVAPLGGQEAEGRAGLGVPR